MDKKLIAEKFIRLVEIVEILRGPDGCPWDKDQTHESLLPYFLEEVYELIESVDFNDHETFKEELGDIMLHVVLQAQIYRENSDFTLSDSLQIVNDKLVRRHPHVFGGEKTNAAFHAKQNWEAVKHKEKNRESRLDGVPLALPALIRAQRLQEKAAFAGFDWEQIEQVWEKIYEELKELKQAQSNNIKEEIENELGDVLFAIVNLSRFLSISAEDALRKSTQKFNHRFIQVEKQLKKRGQKIDESTIDEMNEIWDMVKNKER
ncbi:MAG: nucleoside triphosphate pyrophosphohydrolase [Candidatus Marinimicrobia bacterium]|nr:nucleoside triphosphate pyrophosphohydrolase [Candidatus Neomarinimicrobiota bacterium]|tara:strand:+ start:15750 stop:16535 length:786 start_codon:yes stop_codon:yes gene_type:complete